MVLTMNFSQTTSEYGREAPLDLRTTCSTQANPEVGRCDPCRQSSTGYPSCQGLQPKVGGSAIASPWVWSLSADTVSTPNSLALSGAASPPPSPPFDTLAFSASPCRKSRFSASRALTIKVEANLMKRLFSDNNDHIFSFWLPPKTPIVGVICAQQ